MLKYKNQSHLMLIQFELQIYKIIFQKLTNTKKVVNK